MNHRSMTSAAFVMRIAFGDAFHISGKGLVRIGKHTRVSLFFPMNTHTSAKREFENSMHEIHATNT
jgi:hypothetical protein